MGKTSRFLIVGFGSIGKRHFDNLKQIENAEVSVLTRRPIDIPATRVYRSLEETGQEYFEAVFITNETALHIATALAFAERGFNLFIEKPLSDSMEKVDELIDIVNKKNLRVMVGCNLRFHPVIQSARDLIQKGEIGRVVSARIEAGQYLPDWRPEQDYRDSYSAIKEKGGGVILDLIHELDYAFWFFGRARKVVAFCAKRSDLEINTEDLTEILIEFENDTLCEVHLDYIQRYPSRALKLIGTEGTIRADLLTNKIEIFEVTKGNWEIIDLNGGFERNRMYLDEVKHFLDYIRGLVEQPLIGLQEGVKVLQIALAAKQSSLTGKAIDIQGLE